MKSSFALLRPQILPALVCFGIALLLARTELFERIENLTADERTKLRTWLKPVPPAADVALIGIDAACLQAFGEWPWNREIHGDFLQLLGTVKPSVVAWDILFIEPQKEDEHFVKGMLLGGANVVLGTMQEEEGVGDKPGTAAVRESRLEPLPRVSGDRTRITTSATVKLPAGNLSKLASLGFVNTPRSADGVVRLAPLVVRVGDEVYPSLSLRSLMEYWHAKPENVTVTLGEAVEIDTPSAKRRIPIDDTGSYRVNYRYALEGSATYSYSSILQRLFARHVEKKTVELPDLTGKILLVGQVADGLSDMGPTPFSPLTPLVLVHVNIVDNILGEDFVRPVPAAAIWAGGIVLGIAGLVRFSNRKLREQVVFALGIPLAYAAGATLLWIEQSRLVPVVAPVFGFVSLQAFMIGRRVIAEQKAKEQIKGMFGSYISPALVSRMVESGEPPRLGGHEENITAYFSDIQAFSTFSEKLPPDRLVELMNEYLTACTDIVQEEGGTLDKYIGDAVVAMFGAPIKLTDHAYRACVASQRVQYRQAELRAKWQAEGDKWPEIVARMQTRIGLNSGACTIGNMGSRTRFNYTMMGDNVNLAARMESGAKSWGVYSMCSEATKLACEQHGGDRVVFRPLGRIVVKGRSTAVPIFEIAGLKEFAPPRLHECIGVFSRGLEKYLARDWAGATACFEQSLQLEANGAGAKPGSAANPSLVYLDIVASYRQQPPPESWDGVYVMKEK